MKAPNWLTPVIAFSLALSAYVSESTRTFAPPSPIPVESPPLRTEPTQQSILAAHPDVIEIPRLFVSALPTRPVLTGALANNSPARVPIKIVVAQLHNASRTTQKRSPVKVQIAQNRRSVKSHIAQKRTSSVARIVQESSAEQTFTTPRRRTLKEKLGRLWIGLKSKLRKNSNSM